MLYKTLAPYPHSLMSIHVRDVHVLIHTRVGVILNTSIFKEKFVPFEKLAHWA